MPGVWYPKRTATKPACAFPSWKSLPASRPDTGRRPANIKKKTSKDKSGPTGFPAGPFAFQAMAFSSEVETGSRPENASKQARRPAQAFGDERPLRTVWLLIG
jgi:hypothetical protein